MIIKIIFFTWVALLGDDCTKVKDRDAVVCKIPPETEIFYEKECDKFGGALGKFKSGKRRYTFNHEGWVHKSVYRGVDLICYKVEIVGKPK